MDQTLPNPISTYVEANARLDLEGMTAAFTDDAVVLDEGGRHEGRLAVRAWIQSATIANKAVFTPDGWREEDGQDIVEGLTSGAIPGSPVRLTFKFTLKDDGISALEIH